MFRRNKHGVQWCDWFCVVVPYKCCSPNAWGQCTSQCPRVHYEVAWPAMRKAFEAGQDPHDFKAEIEISSEIIREVMAERCIDCGSTVHDTGSSACAVANQDDCSD